MNFMKVLLLILMVLVLNACGNHSENAAAKADSSNVITDSAALMNADTTSVIGAAHVGTDTVASSGK